jgi:hypothetical protein
MNKKTGRVLILHSVLALKPVDGWLARAGILEKL